MSSSNELTLRSSRRNGRKIKLREQNYFHKTLLDAIDDVGMQVMIIENGLITYASNRELASAFGFNDDDLAIGVPLLDIIHPDDRPRIVDRLTRRMAGDKDVPNYDELGLVTKSGERREYEVSLASIPGTIPLSIIAIGRDITERKRAEHELLHLQQAINRSADGLFVMNEEFHFIRVNDTSCRMLGYSREELLDMTPMDIDQNVTLEKLQQRAVTTKIGEPYTFETRLRAKDGRIFPVEVSGVLFKEGDNNYCVIMVRDISERIRLEDDLQRRSQHQRMLLDNCPFFVWMKDESSRLIAANQQYARVAGVKTTTELEGKTDFDFFPADLSASTSPTTKP